MEKQGLKWRRRQNCYAAFYISVRGLAPLVTSATIREDLTHTMNILILDTSITQVVVTGPRLSKEEGGSRSN